MKAAVRYYSKTGHTKLIAITIANTLGVEALDITHPLDQYYDHVFLGSAIYAANIDKEVKQYISDNKKNIGTLYNFSTTTLIPSTFNKIKKICEGLDVKISDNEFHCKGAFGKIYQHHPDKTDIQNASKWAQGFLK